MAEAKPPTTPSVKQTQRLQVGLKALIDNPLSFVRNLELTVDEGVNQLSGILIGPENSDYAGGHFKFIIRFPPTYPFKPPDFTFATRMCHPNIYWESGIACHDQLLATWTPTISLTNLLTEMHLLLATPNYDTPVADDPLLDKNSNKAREWTQLYAIPKE